METAQGIVSNCQHTLKVSGGGNHSSTSTTYIALFRVDGRPVQFRSSSPSSISDGDRVSVAGPMWRNSLDAFALHNLTTGETMNSGIWANVAGLIILPLVGLVIGGVVGHLFGTWASLLIAVLILSIMTYLIYLLILTSQAVKAVGG